MGAQYHNGHWYGGGQDIDIQSDPTATSFESGKVPTGDTAQSVLNSKLPQQGAFSGTTDSSGNLVVDIYTNSHAFFGIKVDNAQVLYYFGATASKKLIIHFMNSAGATLANTPVSGTLYYTS